MMRSVNSDSQIAVNPAEIPTPSPSPWYRWALVGFLLLAIGLFFALGLNRYFSWTFVRSHLDDWQGLVRQHLPLTLALFFLLYVAMTALSLPAAGILTLLGGALFGRFLGTAVASIASTLGATLAFLMSRYIFQAWVQARFGPQLRAINQGVERDGTYYLFLMRLIPIFPFFLINVVMALTSIRLVSFITISWVGMIVPTFLYVNAGTELGALDSPAGLLSWQVVSSLALLGLFPLLVRTILRRFVPSTVVTEPPQG